MNQKLLYIQNIMVALVIQYNGNDFIIMKDIAL